MTQKSIYPRQWIEIPRYNPDGTTDEDLMLFQVDMTFMLSTYRCTWGDGCKGVGKSHHGCCDNPVWMTTEDVERVAPYVAKLDSAMNLREIKKKWFVTHGTDNHRTRTVNGSCIFLDTDGCALHKQALRVGEDYRDWKPETCGNVPLHIDEDVDGYIVISNWEQEDWFGHNDWMCTAAPENYDDLSQYVYQRFERELRRIMGDKSYGMLEAACRKMALQPRANGLPPTMPVAVYITTKAGSSDEQ